MQDLTSMLHALRRPRLLMRAARIGAEEYRREIHLPRHLGYGVLPRHGAALVRLMELEGAQNEMRLTGNSAYSIAKHVDILIAMLGEARTLRASPSA